MDWAVLDGVLVLLYGYWRTRSTVQKTKPTRTDMTCLYVRIWYNIVVSAWLVVRSIACQLVIRTRSTETFATC